MKRLFCAAAVAVLAFAQGAKAQTNLQVLYDFGGDRMHFTTTVEGFYADPWGNTFFFIDHDYNTKAQDNHVYAPNGTYWEIARCLNFWKDSPLGAFSAQIEYNGGVYNGYTVNNAYLLGVDYFMHTPDFNNTLNLKALGKLIDYAGALNLNGEKRKSLIPVQFTAVWGMRDIFGVKGLAFSGFADFWFENHTVYRTFNSPEEEQAWHQKIEQEREDMFRQLEEKMQGGQGKDQNYEEWEKEMQKMEEKLEKKTRMVKDSEIVFISEPQLWYNVGQHFGVPNLNVGGEVELSYDFGNTMGFRARPCLGLKWIF